MSKLKNRIDDELRDIQMSDDLKERILKQTRESKPISLQKKSEKKWLWVAVAVVAMAILIPVAVVLVPKLFYGKDKVEGQITFIMEQGGIDYRSAFVSDGESSPEENLPAEPEIHRWEISITVQKESDGTYRYIPKKREWIENEEGKNLRQLEPDTSQDKFYFLNFHYLPDGVKKREGDDTYVMKNGEEAIFPYFVKLEGIDHSDLYYTKNDAAKVFEVNGNTCYIVVRANSEGNSVFDKEVGMVLDDQNMLLEMFVSQDISDEEIERILSGVQIEMDSFREEGYSELPNVVMTYEHYLEMYAWK